MNNEFTYSSADVCEKLDIKSSTLRKWALLLQEAGYRFNYDTNGKRIYSDRDLTLFRFFIEARTPGVTVVKAAKTAVERHKKQATKVEKSEGVTDVASEFPEKNIPTSVSLDPMTKELLAGLVMEIRALRTEVAGLKQEINEGRTATEESLKAIEEKSSAAATTDITPVKRSWLDKLLGRDGAE